MASMLRTLSDELAAAAEAVAPSVVQMHGPRRAAAGVVFDTDLVLTSSRGLDAGGGAKEGYLGIGAMPVTVAGPQLRLGWIDT